MSTGSQNSDFLKSVLGTEFRTPDGEPICRVGERWRGGKKIAIITAWNPNFQSVSATENKKANAQLKRLLAERGKTFETINAWWPDECAFEQSFAVEGLTHGEARELCAKFQQGGYFYANWNHAIRLVLVQRIKE